MENLEIGLEFVIDFSFLNYNLRYNENENEFYVKKGDEWILKKFSSNGKGYLISSFHFEKNKETRIRKHRLVFYVYNQNFDIFKRSTTDNMIDHINGDKSNNRIENLRIVTHRQNHFNRTKAKGYTWNKHTKKWFAQIQVNGRNKYLGLFENEEDAREAYLNAKEIYHIFT